MQTRPELSVIIASFNSKRTIGDCLESLRRQTTSATFEVIVVDSSSDGSANLVARRFPEVKLLRFASRKFPGSARNAGVAAAEASVLSFTDADCVVRSDYVDEVLKAHGDPSLAVGGTIANLEPANIVAWAAYLCEFSEWMPGAQRQAVSNIATANASYKKRAFDDYGGFIGGTYGSDTDFNWRMGRHGLKPLLAPSIAVSHRSIDELGKFLRHEFVHGQDCARMRIRGQGFSALRRWLYAACFWLIPIKLLLVIATRMLKNRTYLRPFVKALPLVALGLGCWCLGELVAYVKPRYGNDRFDA
jgi:glycosyltransferase involved in cell wall biosynthesis